jgi:hypothetical protein
MSFAISARKNKSTTNGPAGCSTFASVRVQRANEASSFANAVALLFSLDDTGESVPQLINTAPATKAATMPIVFKVVPPAATIILPKADHRVKLLPVNQGMRSLACRTAGEGAITSGQRLAAVITTSERRRPRNKIKSAKKPNKTGTSERA